MIDDIRSIIVVWLLEVIVYISPSHERGILAFHLREFMIESIANDKLRDAEKDRARANEQSRS